MNLDYHLVLNISTNQFHLGKMNIMNKQLNHYQDLFKDNRDHNKQCIRLKYHSKYKFNILYHMVSILLVIKCSKHKKLHKLCNLNFNPLQYNLQLMLHKLLIQSKHSQQHIMNMMFHYYIWHNLELVNMVNKS